MKKLVSLVLATMILCVGMIVSLEAATAGETYFEDRQQISLWNEVSEFIQNMERRGLRVQLNGNSWINNFSGSRNDIKLFEQLCEEKEGAVWVNKDIEYWEVCELQGR
ncbi:MAG: hypothetical protein F6K54_07530 [Okeania sp. SIO3B5]|uniref:hypothetical protein n=1 Tax=Okeania sp. SIO3B5 TaxID=2607811 RepID=UPI0013FE8D2F|nr:hypothetical protein [Okeania sp. SIO3B5]NEO52940.1 hypothetical protein [Okeania sp. SIO3B5]